MGHEHHHEHNDSYYQEQLCTIAICGAFAGAAIVLYYWRQNILAIMGFGGTSLFSSFIVWSGFALLVLVVLRAISLWRAAGRAAPAAACAHVHTHEHGEHGHDHDHERCDHDHAHDHVHVHGAATCSSGHDHGPAPWRYVVLLVPIALFLLGLPNTPPKAKASDVKLEQADPQSAPALVAVASLGPLPLQQLALAVATADPPAKGMDFKALESAAQDDFLRKEWQGQMVKVVGQFAHHPRSANQFSIVRFRVQCCAADAIQYEIPALCREGLTGIPPRHWVEVTGRVEFRQLRRPGEFTTVLIVPHRKNIALTNPDPNPYIQ
jgi:hypothetical protein